MSLRKGGNTAAVRFDWPAVEAQFARLVAVEGLSLDRVRIERWADGIASGRVGAGSGALEQVGAAGPESIRDLEEIPPQRRREYAESGRAAIERGGVALAVLNGGMATRFGGAVKGIVEAVGGRSFLEIKLAQAEPQGRVPFLVMNSFATHASTLRFLAERGLERRVAPFVQDVAVRLTPRGELFRTGGGEISPYAPGHGDFPYALRRSGELRRLREAGVQVVQLSNVDNLGAELDPVLVGCHLAHGKPLTAEVARSQPGDAGGAPAIAAGRLQIVEAFRFPAGFDFSTLPYLATNTFLMSIELLEAEHELSWFYVEKQVEGRTAVQMERLIGELTGFVDTEYVCTPRGGPRGRFFPVKTRAELDALRADPALVKRFGGPALS